MSVLARIATGLLDANRGSGAAGRSPADLAASDVQQKLAELQRVARIGDFEYRHGADSFSGSQEFHRILGLDPADPLRLDGLAALVHPDDRAGALEAFERARLAGDPVDVVCRIAGPDGSTRWVQVGGEWKRGATGEGTRLVGHLLDVTEREQAGRSLRAAEKKFRASFDMRPIGMAMTGIDGRVLAVNQGMCAILGRPSEDIVGRYVDDYTHPDDIALTAAAIEAASDGTAPEDRRIEKRYVRPDGTVVPVQLDFVLVGADDGEAPYFLTQVQDVTERMNAQAALVQRNLYDPVTGLANRSLVTDRLRHALLRARLTGVPAALLLVALSDLDEVNDTFGYPVGDAVLAQVSRRLGAALRPGDTLGRLDDDDFLVIADNVDSETEAQRIGHQLADAFSSPFSAAGEPVALTANIGITLTSAADSEDDALRDVSAAVYRARQLGRGRLQVFTPDQRRQSDVMRLRAALKRACRQGEFRVAYQPVIDTGTGRIVSLEALLRWSDPELGAPSPSTFIPVAEEMGLVGAIGEMVLEQVCRDTARIDAAAGARIPISVNLSASQLSEPDLAERIGRTLVEHSVDPHQIMFEVTETAVMADPEAAEACLEALRRQGSRIAVDDFGTGYSSLSLLRQLPVDVVKIDRSFVDGLGTNVSDTLIVDAVISLAHALGLTVIAEGIEYPVHLEELQRLGCRYAQGYLWSAPAEMGQLEEILARPPWRRSPAGPAADAGLRVFEPIALPRSILDSLPCSTAVIDHTGTIIATNLAWKDYAIAAGSEPVGSGVGTNYLAVCDAATGGDGFAARAAAGIRDVLAGRRAGFRGEYECVTPTGCLWFEMTVAPVSSTATGAVVMHFETTPSHLAREALRDSEVKARAMFERAPIGMVRLDTSGRVVAVNAAFAEIVGRSREELEGTAASLVWDRSDLADAEYRFRRLISGEATGYNTERLFRHSDGSVRHTNVSVSLVRSADGEPAFVIVTVEDVTERWELAERLRRSEELDAIGRLAGGIAHEINTPTQFIAANLSYLGGAFAELTGIVEEAMAGRPGSGSGTEELEQLIGEIPAALDDATEGIERVTSIVKALKAFGHPDQERAQPADVNEAVRQTLIVARNEYKYVADLDTDFADLPAVTCFIGELKQAFLNLVVNAADAIRDVVGDGGERGRITVRTRCVDDEVVVTISDTGGGIPAGIADRVFEPFFTTKQVGRGTGQGLALARAAVVEHHGGDLTFRSTAGQGTEFTLRLPVRSGAAVLEAVG